MITQRRKHHHWPLLLLAWSGAFLAAALLAGSYSRAYEALLALADINAGPGPSHFKAITVPPTRRPVSYSAWGQSYEGDLYLPGHHPPQAGIVLVPGVVRNAKDDPRLVAFATTLARARFAVLVPDLAGFRTLQVHPSDAIEIGATFSFLVGRADLAPGRRAGIAALSYAVGTSVLAAMDERIRNQVRFLLGVGGYYDIGETITFFTTGYFRKNAAWEHLEPDPYAAHVFLESCKAALDLADDRAMLESMEEIRLKNPSADTSLFAARLGPEGRALYDLMHNSEPSRTPTLIERLPQAIRNELAQLNLSTKDLTQLKARLILLADPADRMIPYTQSVELARAVPTGQAQVQLVSSLTHVEIKHADYLSWKFLTSGLTDFWRMYRTIYALLGERR